MNVEYRSEILKEGEMISFYCTRCHKELSVEFYNGSGVQQLIGTYNCRHYQWIFVGDPFLYPPWDEEVREFIGNAIAKVNGNGGKYFLLPVES
jgi:hypothetical protein